MSLFWCGHLFVNDPLAEPCRETEKSLEKGDSDPAPAKPEEKELNPGICGTAKNIKTLSLFEWHFLLKEDLKNVS